MSMGKTPMVRGSHMYTNTNRGFKGETLKKIETGRKARDSDRISSALGLNSQQALTEWLERKPSFLLLLIVLQKHFFFILKKMFSLSFGVFHTLGKGRFSFQGAQLDNQVWVPRSQGSVVRGLLSPLCASLWSCYTILHKPCFQRTEFAKKKM